MSIAAKITTHYTPKPLLDLLRSEGHMRFLSECKPEYMSANTKVFVNGAWVGIAPNPIGMGERFKLLRRISAIPIYTSYAWDKQTNEIEIYTDAGRLCRPIFYLNQDKSLSLTQVLERKEYSGRIRQLDLQKRDDNFSASANKVYTLVHYTERKRKQI